MGSFTTTHSITYDIGDGSGSGGGFSPTPGSPSTQTVADTVTDGDADTTFETGDTGTISGQAITYVGTMVVDGVTWPVFSFDAFPDFISVLLDQAPLTEPATPTVSTGATFNNACFAVDTMIATPNGERLVQELSIGDTIMTAQGYSVAVKWIGRTRHTTAISRNVQPVRISAGAFGDTLPHHDLTVTADHGIILDDLVINASALVNGTTINLVPRAALPQHVTYFHIETETHDVIIANGVLAETFVDAADRVTFDNYDEYLSLYGIERIIPEMDRMRISSQRLLPETIKARLGITNTSDVFADTLTA
jgi:hypothetical protein